MNFLKYLIPLSLVFAFNFAVAEETPSEDAPVAAPIELPTGYFKLDTDNVICQNGKKLDLTSRHDLFVVYMSVEKDEVKEKGKTIEVNSFRLEARTYKKSGMEANNCYISSAGPFEYLGTKTSDGEDEILNELSVEQTDKELKKVCKGTIGGLVRKFAKGYAIMEEGKASYSLFEEKINEGTEKEEIIEGFFLTRQDPDGFTRSCKKKGDDNPPTLRFVRVEEKEVVDNRP